MKPVRVGLVGCGKVGTVHAAALKAIPEAGFAACCDADPARAAAFAARYGARPYIAHAVRSDEWNQPRCWSWPSRYRSASGPVSWPAPACEPRSTVVWVVPESNHTSRMSELLV